MKKWLRRGELARALGISTPTIKYYTVIGLFPVHKRTLHGQYLYELDPTRDRLNRILELKRKRLRIQEIKDLLEMEELIEG